MKKPSEKAIREADRAMNTAMPDTLRSYLRHEVALALDAFAAEAVKAEREACQIALIDLHESGPAHNRKPSKKHTLLQAWGRGVLDAEDAIRARGKE